MAPKPPSAPPPGFTIPGITTAILATRQKDDKPVSETPAVIAQPGAPAPVTPKQPNDFGFVPDAPPAPKPKANEDDDYGFKPD